MYPAATRIGHGAPDIGGSLVGLDEWLDYSAVSLASAQSEDAIDAAVCTLAAADFLSGRAVPPLDHETALVEGWIWAPMSRQQPNQSFHRIADKPGSRWAVAFGMKDQK